MKVRSDSLFAKLTPARREELLQRCVEEGLSLADGVELLRGWGVSASPQALSRLLSTQGFAWRLERAKAAAEATRAMPTFDAERARLLEQKTFEAVAAADCHPKILLALRSLELKAAEVRLQERRVALLEKKESAAKETLTDAKLTDAERGEKLREIFGIQ